MTMTRPWRRITLHFSHIFLTLGRTFTLLPARSLVPVGDPTSAEVVGGELHLDAIARQDADVVHAHLPGDVSQHLVAVLELDAEHRIRQRFHDCALEHDRVFLRLREVAPAQERRKGAPQALALPGNPSW